VNVAANKFIVIAAALLFAGFIAMSWLAFAAGISSLDAHGIMQVAGKRIHDGSFDESRPPGHPLNEYWMLPGFALLFGSSHVPGPIGPEIYGAYQLLGGCFCLIVFWFLLGEAGVTPTRRVLATACLTFAPTFLLNAGDGEEFLWATGCFLAVLWLISRNGMTASLGSWLSVMVLAAACSGYRLEIGVMTMGVAVVSLLASRQVWSHKLALLTALAVLVGIVWAPLLLHHGASPPYDIPLALKTRLEVGIYKILFTLLGVIPMAFAVLFYLGWWKRFRLLPSFESNILAYWAPRLFLLFFALFFVYPTKISVVLPGLACLILWGAMQARGWVWAGFVAGCIAVQLVNLDCFVNRVWVGPNVQPSLWAQFYTKKPCFRWATLVKATDFASNGRHVIIANVYAWDIDWNLKHGTWTPPGPPHDSFGGWVQSYDAGPGIVASRVLIDRPALLKDYIARGYDIKIDQSLYREVFQRYAMVSSGATGEIDGLPCDLVTLPK
jgi:hypothetical protein